MINTKTNRVLAAFKNGEELTEAQMRYRFRSGNPREIVRTLRNKGYAIYLNRTMNSKGEVHSKYSLGIPSRAVIAAGIAALGVEAAGLVY